MPFSKRDEKALLVKELEEVLKLPSTLARTRTILQLTKAIDGLRQKPQERSWKPPKL
jgi:hypothetical protein